MISGYESKTMKQKQSDSSGHSVDRVKAAIERHETKRWKQQTKKENIPMARKKLGVDVFSVREEKKVRGVLGEIRPFTRDGEVQTSNAYGTTLHVFSLTDKATGEVKDYWFDGGLKGAFKLAKVTPGMNLEIEHKGEREFDMDDGKKGTVQKYDIYALD